MNSICLYKAAKGEWKEIQNEETFGGYIGSSGSECGYVGSGLCRYMEICEWSVEVSERRQ